MAEFHHKMEPLHRHTVLFGFRCQLTKVGWPGHKRWAEEGKMDYQAFLDLAKSRRSIYTFIQEPVSNEDIMKALSRMANKDEA